MAEVIIVPSPLVVSNGMFYNHELTSRMEVKTGSANVLVDGVMHNVMQMDPPSMHGYFRHDPIMDYAKWYGVSPNTYQLQISETELNDKFWWKHEFIQWMKNSLQDTVLIQETTKHTYLLMCALFDDFDKLQAFLSNKTKEYTFWVNRISGTPTESKYRIEQWLLENVKSAHSVSDRGNRLMISIMDRQEAMKVMLEVSGGEDSIVESF